MKHYMDYKMQISGRPTWAEVDLKAIRNNFRHLKRITKKNTRILAVIKANAYGHGIVHVAGVLKDEGADYFGVSSVNEGRLLREKGFKIPILIFGNLLNCFAKDVIKYHLTPSISTLEFAKTLNKHAENIGHKVPVHIQIDTGMGRVGIWQDDTLDFVKHVSCMKYIYLEGLYTHFPCADTDSVFTKKQIQILSELVSKLKKAGIDVPYVHAANSMGLCNYPKSIFNLVRPGIMLYGLYPHKRLHKKIYLQPALSIKTKVTFKKEVPKGRSISYGRTYVTGGRRVIATLPIGYNNGYIRAFSNRASVIIGKKRCPLVGRVTMDQIMVDVTRLKTVSIGQEAVILGRQGTQEVTADELADLAGTINYEIICLLGNRLPRIYS